ncbi:MAG TPA: NAD(P)-dependent oxidoreductase [Polyangia bacterium]|nr:NAD(P)-dependent oxidoreductase [Polyangia bacterium]
MRTFVMTTEVAVDLLYLNANVSFMKIAVIGAAGNIGQRIVREALDRHHEVTAIGRHPERLGLRDAELSTAACDVTAADELARVVTGHDAIVCAVGPAHDGSQPTLLVDAARAVIEGARRARVKRLLNVGGAGSLYVAPGLQLVDTPTFPAAWKGVANAHRDALAIFMAVTDLDWTYVSPAAIIEPGARTGQFRRGGDELLVDAQGQSKISSEDYAMAVVDELEKPRALRRRMTVAY